jgi:hypothetical protein
MQDVESDIKVVNIIEEWDVLADYVGEKLRFYRFLKTVMFLGYILVFLPSTLTSWID